LNLKILSQDVYRVLAVKEGERCPAEDFLTQGEKTTAAYRAGLVRFIQEIARNGLQQVPSAWWHEANKEHGIYELIKGPLRLFFFKGANGDIAVCTEGTRKSGQKADKARVQKAIQYKKTYLTAIEKNTCELEQHDIE
jgi:hypothetical protein